MSCGPIVLSSEHTTRFVPADYRKLFSGQQETLESHRGWDPGVKYLENAFSRHFGVEVIRGSVSRLLIEMNRSLHHPKLFSEFCKTLSGEQKSRLIETYYQPYRRQIREAICTSEKQFGIAIHFSLHTFTPVFNGQPRNVDVGLLYDPSRCLEKEWVNDWIKALAPRLENIRLRRNQPYRGVADGLTKGMRQEFTNYVGIEVELSQRIASDRSQASKLSLQLAESAASVIEIWRAQRRFL